MTSGPKTLIEFQEMFPNEDVCWAHLRAVRWPEGFECPACQHRESSWLSRRRLEQCRACRRQTSVTAGTVLHGTRVGLRIWFLAFFFLGRHKKAGRSAPSRGDLTSFVFSDISRAWWTSQSGSRPRAESRNRE